MSEQNLEEVWWDPPGEDGLTEWLTKDPFDQKDFSIRIGCAKCGGDEFHVASGEHYTAIRCVKCRWETGIHYG